MKLIEIFRKRDRSVCENRDIILADRDSRLTICVGNQASYSHSVHGSVGFWYSIEYDHDAFVLSHNVKYDDPESVEKGLCGGDSAVLTCTLRAMRRGTYVVKVVHDYRGDIERVVTYTITVK